MDGKGRWVDNGIDHGGGGELLHVAPVILLGVAVLKLAQASGGFDDGAVETEMAALAQLVLEEGSQHEFRSVPVEIFFEAGADDLERGMIRRAIGEVVAEEGAKREAVLAPAGDGPLAGKVLEKADHEHLEVGGRVDPRTTTGPGITVGGEADLPRLLGKAVGAQGLVELAVEATRRAGRQIITGHPELTLFRGLRVSFLEHPTVYSKDLIGEGFFNRLLTVE